MACVPPPLRTIPDRPPERCPHHLYVTGTASLALVATHLAGQPGCSLPRLKARCHQEGWVEERRAFRREVERRLGERLGYDGPAPVAWLTPKQQLRQRDRLQRMLVQCQRMAARGEQLLERARRLAA